MLKKYAITIVAAVLCLIAGVAAAADPALFIDEKIYFIEASDGADGDRFGAADIAISRDGSTLVVGAMFDHLTTPDAGSAYVFTRDECVGWTQAQKLYENTLSSESYFGQSVAISDDGTYIAVGAPAATWGGSVYIYYYSGGTWTKQKTINHPASQSGAQLGYSIALSGDGDVIAIGCPHDDEEGSLSGAVYTHYRTGTTWFSDALIVGDDTGAGSIFGTSLDLSSEGDALVVSSPSQGGSGAVYIFDDSWDQTADITRSGAVGFGTNVSMSSDGLTVLVSETSYNNTGAVHVYNSATGSWALDETIVPASATSGDDFGYSASISDDKLTILATSPSDNSDTGTAYIFSNATGTWLQDKAWGSPDDPATGDDFGFSSVISSDGAYAAVACPGYNSDTGAAFVSYLEEHTLAQALIDYVRYYLYEPNPLVYEDSELLAWLNHGVMDLVSRSQCLQYTEDITLINADGSYDITGDYLHIAGAIYNDAKGLRRGNMESLGNQFHAIGEPNAFVTWNDDLWIYPRPDADAAGNTLTLYGLERPDTMTMYSCLEIPETFVRPLIYYAVAQALYKVGKFSKARDIMMWYFEESDRLRMDYFTLTKELAAKSK